MEGQPSLSFATLFVTVVTAGHQIISFFCTLLFLVPMHVLGLPLG